MSEAIKKKYKLNDKQYQFLLYYIGECKFNASKAYLKAYPSATPKSARTLGAKLLAKVGMDEAITELMAPAREKQLITAERIEAELAKIAFGSIREFATVNQRGVTFRDFEDDDIDAGAVSEISFTSGKFGDTYKVKMHDKLKANEMLARRFPQFAEQRKVKLEGFEKLSDEELDKELASLGEDLND